MFHKKMTSQSDKPMIISLQVRTIFRKTAFGSTILPLIVTQEKSLKTLMLLQKKYSKRSRSYSYLFDHQAVTRLQ